MVAPHAEALLSAARESYDDFEMGIEASRILGEAAELPRWNAVISGLGGKYVPVRNENARNQAKRHLYEMGRPLRAFARHAATRDADLREDDQAELFAEIKAAHERLDVDEEWNRRCEEWANRWWRVPFAEVLGLVRSRYARMSQVEPHLRSLDGVGSVGRLKEVLRTCGVSLEPDPLDVARANQYRLNRTVRRVWDVYRVWLGREKADSVPSARAPELGLEDRMYLRELPGAVFFDRAKGTIQDAAFREATDGCRTVEEMRERLGIVGPPATPPAAGATRSRDCGASLRSRPPRDVPRHLRAPRGPPKAPQRTRSP